MDGAEAIEKILNFAPSRTAKTAIFKLYFIFEDIFVGSTVLRPRRLLRPCFLFYRQ